MLAEFAIVSLVVWILLAGSLELGRAFAAQHQLQNAARAAARALSLEAAAAQADFATALESLFDEGFLVIDEELLRRCGVPGFDEPGHAQGLEQLFAERPLLNRLLRPLMIHELTEGRRQVRYPGALLLRAPEGGFASCASGSRYTVAVPLVRNGGRVEWHAVVEEARFTDASTGNEVGFPLRDGGWSSLRIHYPFQAAGLVSWVEADETNPATGRSFQRPEEVSALEVPEPTGIEGTPATGLVDLGLGRVYMLGREVRPYRRVLSASAAFRREVFL